MRVKSINGIHIDVHVVKAGRASEQSTLLSLIQGLSHPDIMKRIISINTHLGIQYITPVITQKSASFKNEDLINEEEAWIDILAQYRSKVDRYFPTMLNPTFNWQQFQDYSSIQTKYHLRLLLLENHPDAISLKTIFSNHPPQKFSFISVFSPPENGLSDDEIKYFLNNNFFIFSLNMPQLPTELTGYTALSQIRYVIEKTKE